MAAIHSCMMLKSITADSSHEPLQVWHSHDRPSAKGVERVVSKVSFSYIGTNHASGIIRADSPKCHRAGRRPSLKCTYGVFLAEYGAKNGSRPNPDVGRKSFAQLPQ